MAELRNKIAGLSVEERSKLEMRLLQQRKTSTVKTAIHRRATLTPVLSSFSQRRLWFLDQFEPGSSVYNIPSTVHLQGELDVNALAAALNALVERHETLRTYFALEKDDPLQVIAPALKVPLPVDDLASLPDEEQEVELQQRVQSEISAPFNLAQGPLLRARLFKLATQTYVLVLTLHHIISDGWSMGVLMRELSVLYRACRQGVPSSLPVLQIQYADYAIWQRGWLQGAVLEKQLSYWREQLKDLPILDLPTDRPRPAMQRFGGAHVQFKLPETLTKRLEALSQQAGGTLFMTLLATFQLLLQRYSGQDDIVVGSPIAGRNKVEVEGLIGLFINTLVLRTDLSGDPAFIDLLKRVREVALNAYAHQDLPFDKLVEELQPERDTSRNPLFQVMFILQNAPRAELDLPDIKASLHSTQRVTAKFDLTLSMTKLSNGFKGVLEYNTDLFDAATIERLASHFQTLLQNILAAPDQPLSTLTMLSEAERQTLLVDWNATALAVELDTLVHQLIEAQVARTPDAVAVGFEDRTLTYRTLNEQANQLAHYLQTLGVEPDVLVGVALERSEWMLVALLGVLKAGGAYVPMDPDYPEARLGYMLAHAGAQVLISQDAMLERLPTHQAKVICLDRDWARIAGLTTDQPVTAVRPDHLAYVIYTSGSTGKPKGVQIPHGAVVNFLNSMARKPGINARDVLLAVTTLSFDIAVLELYLPLTVGARVQIASRDVAGDGNQLASALNETGATLMQATPTTWRILLSAGWQGSEDFKVLAGGEALPRDLANELVDRAGEVWNMYGPTETTIWSICEKVTAKEGPVPIGRPISNTRVYVLDKNMQPVPVGVPGELYIGGHGVARGYLHAPDLTQARFVADPFAAQPGGCLYRTGDQVRYMRDGRLDYLTRLDNQVKVRGFRIELGEIEAGLAAHPVLKQSVVAVREDRPGDVRLVAYIVPLPGQNVTVTEVRKHLRRTLPDYMVPQHVVELQTIPMTPNGKIDRKALPSPFNAGALEEHVYIAPETETEQTLAAIWQEVLGVERVGIHDNFFEIGGHSLLAVQIINRFGRRFDLEVPVGVIFELPTVTELADYLDAARKTSTVKTAIPCRATLTPALSSFSQRRLWFLDQFEPDSSVYNIPSSVRLQGELDVNALAAALNALVERHETLRTYFALEKDDPLQVIAPALKVPMPVDDLASLPDEEQEVELQQRVQSEISASFNLAQGPLLRARLFKLATQTYVLVLTLHHIISDGWSMGVLMRELSVLYRACRQGVPSSLPVLQIQYADYAIWQRGWLQGAVLEKQLSYWREQLKDLPILDLPTDRPRPAMQRFGGAHVQFKLPETLTKRLEALSQQAGGTLFMTLLAAFQLLLQRYSGQDDIVVGSPIAGRNKVEVEGLIGLFINTLVLRTDLSGDPAFIDLLKRVREVALNAYAHQDLPFDKLVEELQPERDTSRNPLFQVMFILQNAPRAELDLPDIKASLHSTQRVTAKFDLTLSMTKLSNGFKSVLEYNTDLFDAATIERLASHFQTLLQNILAAPDQPLSTLTMLSEAERQTLLVDWNATALAVEPDTLVHQLIEAQVARTPDAVAVGFEDQTLTYRTLNEQANQLAHYLQTLSVGPDVLVGVALERSEWMLVALLGVLKAGGAYVPMDPDYPEARLGYMLAHAGAQVLISQDAMLERLPTHQAQVICLDRDWARIAELTTDRPVTAVRPDHLAYVIYTSGSTGKPKGVQIPHGAVVNFLNSMARKPGINARDVLLAVTTLSFDIAVLELYLPLTVGARVQIASRDVAGDGNQLASALNETEATLMQATPTTWRILLSAGWQGSEDFKVLAGGEALPRDLANELVDRAGEVWNMYGPTETTIWSICEKVTAKEGPVPIGRPISNTRVYVLDKNMQPVPVGVPGELYIGGHGVARGYLHAPDLTQARFVADPFAAQPGGCLYRTGDQVRYMRDGRLDYLTRLDNQVKVRGFRIELGEIEAGLTAHPALKQSVVAVREDRPGDVRLVAYIVPLPGQNVTVTEVRKHLRRTLPDYMVPQHVVELQAIPMTPNGKIDRKALPSPFNAGALEEHVYIAPETETEQTLAAIWQEVLGVERVGIHDNFFEIGGHSLLSIHLIARIKDKLDVALSPREILFNNLKELAEHCDRMTADYKQGKQSDESVSYLAKNLFGKLKKRLGLPDI